MFRLVPVLVLCLTLITQIIPAQAQSLDCDGLPLITQQLSGCSAGGDDMVFESSIIAPAESAEDDLVLELFSNSVCEAAASCDVTKNQGVIPSVDITIQFEINSHDILNSEQEKMAGLAEALRHPALSEKAYLVIGHTDTTGSLAYNLDLSKRRSVSVMSRLSKLGVDIARLESMGLGPEQLLPGKPEDDPSHRRVTIYAID